MSDGEAALDGGAPPDGIGQLGGIVLDAADPRELAVFYARLLGWRLLTAGYDGAIEAGVVAPDGRELLFQSAPEQRASTWPSGEVPQQIHFDVYVPELDAAERDVLAIGATRADHQPGGEQFRVYADPAGHPFCLCRAG